MAVLYVFTEAKRFGTAGQAIPTLQTWEKVCRGGMVCRGYGGQSSAPPQLQSTAHLISWSTFSPRLVDLFATGTRKSRWMSVLWLVVGAFWKSTDTFTISPVEHGPKGNWHNAHRTWAGGMCNTAPMRTCATHPPGLAVRWESKEQWLWKTRTVAVQHRMKKYSFLYLLKKSIPHSMILPPLCFTKGCCAQAGVQS